jgi:hypothetical protein
MAAPYVPPVPPAGPGALLRNRIERSCQDALNDCLYILRNNPNPDFNFAECIDAKKAEIKERFAHYQGVHGIDVNGLVDNYNWEIPAQGGKRKRRTRHRKRFHKKNRTRRHRKSV